MFSKTPNLTAAQSDVKKKKTHPTLQTVPLLREGTFSQSPSLPQTVSPHISAPLRSRRRPPDGCEVRRRGGEINHVPIETEANQASGSRDLSDINQLSGGCRRSRWFRTAGIGAA